jgi:hypothetical protein
MANRHAFLWLSLLFDALLFGATSVYAVFAYHQWQTMKTQTSAIESQLAVMQGQLTAMQDQANSRRVGIRPYLQVGAYLREFSYPNLKVQLLASNGGNVPANVVSLEWGFVIQGQEKIPGDCAGNRVGAFVVQPHGSYQLMQDAKLTVPLNDLQRNEKFLFLCGSGSFASGGETFPIHFCYEYLPQSRSLSDCANLVQKNQIRTPSD